MKKQILSKLMLPIKVVLASILVFGGGVFWLWWLGIHIIINPSSSLPQGFYLVKAGLENSLKIGDIVEMQVPPEFKNYLYGRGWLLADSTLLKQVGGLPGDTYCVYKTRFLVNNIDKGKVFEQDRQGRDLPRISGCKSIDKGNFLPIATNSERSFDGRYMGEITQKYVIGKAIPLWIF